MANVIECKNKIQFSDAWSKSTAQSAVQVGSKLPEGQHKGTFKGFRIVEYERNGNMYKIGLCVFTTKLGKDTIEDTGLISESDASKVTPKKNLVVTTTPNPNQEGTFRNRVTL